MKPALALLLLTALASAPAVAQQADRGAAGRITVSVPAPSADVGAVASADTLFDAGRALDALDLLEAYLGRRPGDPEARWRAARAAIALGIMAGEERTEERWLERAIGHAERAVERAPDDPTALYWLVASRGWLAMVVGNPVRIADLADDVLSDARRLLDLEPGHAGAHHALGKLHYEVMTLNAFERFLARHLLGVDVASFASWDASADHLERAVAREPDMVLYRLDLALTYAEAGRTDAARAALRGALELPSAVPPDPLFKRRARALLDELGESGPGTRGGDR